jgi:CO/xanthine dehydrogenase FAD-binding subunit
MVLDMIITHVQPNGLYLVTQATLAQLVEDEAVRAFAGGLLYTALLKTCHLQLATCNLCLAEVLHQADSPQTYPLLTALLVLDAEIHALIGEDRRILSLPGFLSYRPSLPPDKVPLETLRLPPLNPGGHYAFAVADNGAFLAVRLDLNPALNVAGHVRIAASSITRPPTRLIAAEERLERHVLAEEMIKTAIAAGSADLLTPLTQIEAVKLVETLKGFIQSTG